MEVLNLLNSEGLKGLEKFAIKVTNHPLLPLHILNYSQLDSKPKDHPIVTECRGLVVSNLDGFELVARAFPRFFNWGEVPLSINLDDCLVQEKVDGSLILIYYWDRWRVNTRGSFADGMPNNLVNKTWEEFILEALDLPTTSHLDEKLDRSYTYVCELQTPHTQIVMYEEKPTIHLLSIFEGEKEVDWEAAKKLWPSEWNLCPQFNFGAAHAISNYKGVVNSEGYIIREVGTNARSKLKSDWYLRLHHLLDNGAINNKKRLLDIVIRGEVDEVINWRPHLKNAILDLQREFNKAKDNILWVWDGADHKGSQKDFAISVCGPWEYLMFRARKEGGSPIDYINADYLIDRL